MIASTLLDYCKQKKWTLATAESCTGGLLSGALTDVSGSSSAFLGGIVAYSNAVKEHLLGVPFDLLQDFGAVSEQVAKKMAEGAKEKLNTTHGLSTTGIAGPGGGSIEKPVGLVYIGFADGIDGPKSLKCNFSGTREEIRHKTVLTALEFFMKHA